MSNIKKNLIYQIIYRVLTVLTPLITSPWLSRALGPTQIGVFSATQAYVNYFLLFAILGVENYGTRAVSKVQGDIKAQETAFWNIYAVQLVASLIAALGYFITIPFLREGRRLYYCLQGVWLIAYGSNINWFFFGIERFEVTAKRDTIVKIFTVAAIILFVKTPEDLAKYILIMAGGQAISQLIMWPYLRKSISFSLPQWERIKLNIKPMFVLFVPILAGTVFHIMDKTMLDILADETSLGYYYSADKIINIPLGVITAVGTVMMPRLSNMLSGDHGIEETLGVQKGAIELTTFLAASIGFGIAAIAKEFVPVFFGPGYEPCIMLLYLFVPVLITKAWNNAVRAQYLIPAEKDGAYIKAVCAGAAVNLILNYVLIKRYGAEGAVIATFIAEFVVLLVELVYAQKEVPYIKLFAENWYYLLVGILMFAVVRISRGFLLLNGIACLLVLVLIGGAVFMTVVAFFWSKNGKSVFGPILHRMIRRKKI